MAASGGPAALANAAVETSPSPPARRRPALHIPWFPLALIGSLVVPALLFGLVAYTGYKDSLEQAVGRVERAVRVAEQHATRVVETSVVLATLVDSTLAGLDNDEIAARAPALHRQLAAVTGGLDQLQSVWLWDETGRPLISSRFAEPPPTLNVADREYFRRARSATGKDWYITEPLRSRATGETFFDFSRRHETRDGRFAGALSVSLRPGYFSRFFDELAAREEGLAILLLRDDGVVIAHHPERPLETRLAAGSLLRQLMAQGRAQGRFAAQSPRDGLQREVGYRRVGTLPLYVAATLEREKVLAAWRRSLVVPALLIFPLALCTAGAIALAWRRSRREARALATLGEQMEQRLRAEEALRQGQKLEALGRISGGVAHDFNNLLMVVQSSTFLLRRLHGAPLEKVEPILATIDRAVKSGTQLTRQLLAFARRQPLRPQRLQLQELWTPLLGLVRASAGSSVAVQGHIGDDLPPVNVDRAELELALLNLAINARDAMPHGGTLEIRIQRLAPPLAAQPCVSIEVRDTGVGMSEDVRAKLFEPFFTTKAPGKGTGLGLSQVHAFAVRSGGTVSVASEPGQGSTFTLLLPAAEEPAPSEATTAPPLPQLSGQVLLAEDNDDVAQATGQLLAEIGLTHRRVRSGDEALTELLLRSRDYCLLLSDVVMPGALSGIALASAARRDFPDVPVLLMTGYTEELDKAQAAGLLVVSKPCTLDELACAIQQALDAAAQRQARAVAASAVASAAAPRATRSEPADQE